MSSIIRNGILEPQARVLTANGIMQPKTINEQPPQPVKEEEVSSKPEEINFDELKEKAREKGLAQGRKDAQLELNEKISALEENYAEEKKLIEDKFEKEAEKFRLLTKELNDYKEKLKEEAETAAIQVAMECLYKIAQDKESYASLVSRVIGKQFEKYYSADPLKLRVPTAEKHTYESLNLNDIEPLDIVYDDELNPGECQIESNFASTEIGLISQLEQLKSSLLDVLAQRQSDA